MRETTEQGPKQVRETRPVPVNKHQKPLKQHQVAVVGYVISHEQGDERPQMREAGLFQKVEHLKGGLQFMIKGSRRTVAPKTITGWFKLVQPGEQPQPDDAHQLLTELMKAYPLGSKYWVIERRRMIVDREKPRTYLLFDLVDPQPSEGTKNEA